MIKTETQIKRLEEIGTETMSLIRKAKRRMQVQLEVTPSDYCDQFSRTHPLTLAIDKFLTVYNSLDALMYEVDETDYRFYQENPINPEQKMDSDKSLNVGETIYLVSIELLDEGLSDGLKTQESMLFKEKVNAVTYCMNRINEQILKAFEEGEEYEFHNEDDEFFVTIDERTQTHYVIEDRTLMN